MKKLSIFIISLLFIAPCFSQSLTKICDGKQFEWVFACDSTSLVVIRTNYNYPDTSWSRYDTFTGNTVGLVARSYESYNLISIDNDTDVPHDTLKFEVCEMPDAITTELDGIVTIKINSYCNYLDIIEINDSKLFYQNSWETPPDSIYVTLPSGSYYAIFEDNSGANCKKTIHFTIN
jgi:hypothetical protein